jgi:enediyne polyketide synthase
MKTALAAVPRQQVPITEPARSASPGRTQPRERGGQTAIFALCGTEPTAIAATLDIAARSAADLTDVDLRDLARHLAAAAQHAADSGAPLRVTVTAATPQQLAARARRAAQLLRGELHRGQLHRGELRPNGSPATMTIEPGISIAAGAAGRIVLVFPGLAESTAEHTSLLAASLSGLRLLDRIGVRAESALGYSFGEITGLVWAGCLPAAEAARLAALRGRVLRGCTSRPAAMARVSADAALARQLCAMGDLHIAAYETPTSHLLTGPASGIRDLARMGAETGVAVEILPATSAVHSPAMARCAAPLRSVVAATPFAPPRRRLISSITGQQVRPADDIVGMLAGQLGRPVLFAQAMALAAREADLLVIAGPDPGNSLAAMATAASGVPAIRMPAVADEADRAAAIAALFAAGAIGDLLAARPNRADENTVPVTWVVPPARHGEAACGQNGAGRGTTIRSGKNALNGLASARAFPSRAAAACRRRRPRAA